MYGLHRPCPPLFARLGRGIAARGGLASSAARRRSGAYEPGEKKWTGEKMDPKRMDRAQKAAPVPSARRGMRHA